MTTGVTGLTLSGDGKKMLALKGGGRMFFGDASGDKLEPLDASGLLAGSILKKNGGKSSMMLCGWRLHFYDPNMHGLDWERVAQNMSLSCPIWAVVKI